MQQRTLFLTLLFTFGPLVLLAETSPSAAKTLEYRVQRGDCLWNISKRVLKDPFKWPLIYTANEGQIRNPNLIYPGQRFAIPPPSAITRENLREATQVAYARLAPIVVVRARSEPVAMDRAEPAAKTHSPPEKAMVADKGVVANPPPATEEKPATTISSADGSMGLIILVVLIAAIGGFFIWRKMAPTPEEKQEPKPLSSFPEVRNVTPMPDPRVKPSESTPAPSTAQPAPTVMPEKQEPRPLSSFPEVRNVAPMPEPQPKPVEPAPAAPEAQVPPSGTNSPPVDSSTDKPGDNTPPPSSTHAA